MQDPALFRSGTQIYRTSGPVINGPSALSVLIDEMGLYPDLLLHADFRISMEEDGVSFMVGTLSMDLSMLSALDLEGGGAKFSCTLQMENDEAYWTPWEKDLASQAGRRELLMGTQSEPVDLLDMDRIARGVRSYAVSGYVANFPGTAGLAPLGNSAQVAFDVITSNFPGTTKHAIQVQDVWGIHFCQHSNGAWGSWKTIKFADL